MHGRKRTSLFKRGFILLLSFQLAILPGCSSSGVSRVPANAIVLREPPWLKALTRELILASLSSLRENHWKVFDHRSGKRIYDEDSLNRLDLAEGEMSDLVLKHEKMPVLVRFVAKKPGANGALSITVATYSFPQILEDSAMSANELNLGSAKNLLVEKLTLTGYKKREDLRLRIQGAIERVSHSIHDDLSQDLRDAGTDSMIAAVMIFGFMATLGAFVSRAGAVAVVGVTLDHRIYMAGVIVVFAGLAIAYYIYSKTQLERHRIQESLD
jgi:hypothetical protein